MNGKSCAGSPALGQRFHVLQGSNQVWTLEPRALQAKGSASARTRSRSISAETLAGDVQIDHDFHPPFARLGSGESRWFHISEPWRGIWTSGVLHR